MGDIYKLSEKHYPKNPPAAAIIVEIGSDNLEGSTAYFSRLAEAKHTMLVSVDISPLPSQRLAHLRNTEWVVKKGSDYTRDFKWEHGIACLYLDNFDYIFDIHNMPDWVIEQKQMYRREWNIDLDNQSCQVEHIKQMIDLMPNMISEGIVVCDDTYRHNNCWTGKAGPAVTYLLANDYKIVEGNYPNGVILRAP